MQRRYDICQLWNITWNINSKYRSYVYSAIYESCKCHISLGWRGCCHFYKIVEWFCLHGWIFISVTAVLIGQHTALTDVAVRCRMSTYGVWKGLLNAPRGYWNIVWAILWKGDLTGEWVKTRSVIKFYCKWHQPSRLSQLLIHLHLQPR